MSTAVWPKPPRNIQGYEALAMQEQYHQEHFRELHTKSMVIWYHGQTCPHVRWSHMSSKSPNIHADTNGVSTSLMDDTSQIIHHRQDYTCWIGSTPVTVKALLQIEPHQLDTNFGISKIRCKTVKASKQMVNAEYVWCRRGHPDSFIKLLHSYFTPNQPTLDMKSSHQYSDTYFLCTSCL